MCQLRSAIPAAMACAEGEAGRLSLAAYSQRFGSAKSGGKEPLQDGGDIIGLAEAKTAALFSPELGKALRRELETRFAALTANHHGIDFHAEFLQGNFVFSLASTYAVPVFAWGGVPCDNAAFPRGVLFAPRRANTHKPFHVPLLSNAARRAFVSARAACAESDIGTGRQSEAWEALSENERGLLRRAASEIYGSPSFLNRKMFHEQMSVGNALLWERLCAASLSLPPLVCLELQQLARDLLILDLQNPYSLCSLILTEPQLTGALYARLNGERACWTHTQNGMERGTFLFWAINEKKQGERLCYSEKEHTLCGGGQEFSLNARDLTAALREGKILPSLYLAFMLTAAARGLVCAGGVFQCAYLPVMAEKTAEALQSCGENALAARLGVSSPFCTGALPLRVRFPLRQANEERNCGAGGMEILQAGGLTPQVWEQLGAMSLKDAFFCSLDYQYEDLMPQGEREENWQELLACRGGIFLPQEGLPCRSFA